MFFELSKSPSQALPIRHTVGEWTIATDHGWTVEHSGADKVTVKKGLPGNGCEIVLDGHTWSVNTDEIRHFPIWRIRDGVTNFSGSGQPVYNLQSIAFEGNMVTSFHERPTWMSSRSAHTLDRDSLVEKLCENLITQTSQIKDTGLPIIAPNSKGMDCAVVRSCLDYCGIKYHDVNISKEVCTTLPDLPDAHAFWGYKQIVNEGAPHLQATGFNGDEYMSRNPLYVSMFLRDWGIDLEQRFDQAGDTYMRNFFDRHYRQKIRTFHYPENAYAQMVDMMINDFQVWHVDHCLTWSPFIDTELLMTGLRMDAETAVDQCINAGVSLDIIRKLNPKRIADVEKNKNGRKPI